MRNYLHPNEVAVYATPENIQNFLNTAKTEYEPKVGNSFISKKEKPSC